MTIEEALEVIDSYEDMTGDYIIRVYAIDENHGETDGTLAEVIIKTAEYIRRKARSH